MKTYVPKLNQKSFVINSSNPKKQDRYLLYYHKEEEEMSIVVKLDRIIIMKHNKEDFFKDFIFITRIEKDEG